MTPEIALALALALGPTRPAPAQPAAAKIVVPLTWGTNYGAALQASTESGKPILIDFRIPDCVHCDRMESGPFKDPAVYPLLERFILVRLDAEQEEKLLEGFAAINYPITRYPTMVMLAGDRQHSLLLRVEGYTPANMLQSLLLRVEAASKRYRTANPPLNPPPAASQQPVLSGY